MDLFDGGMDGGGTAGAVDELSIGNRLRGRIV